MSPASYRAAPPRVGIRILGGERSLLQIADSLLEDSAWANC